MRSGIGLDAFVDGTSGGSERRIASWEIGWVDSSEEESESESEDDAEEELDSELDVSSSCLSCLYSLEEDVEEWWESLSFPWSPELSSVRRCSKRPKPRSYDDDDRNQFTCIRVSSH